MKKQSYASWDMAGLRARSYATPRPRIVPAPIGPTGATPSMLLGALRACRGCGHEVCGCERFKSPVLSKAAQLEGLKREFREEHARAADVKRGDAYRCLAHGMSLGASCRFCDYSKALGEWARREATAAALPQKSLARQASEPPVFVRPYPDRDCERGYRGHPYITPQTINGQRCMVYNPNCDASREAAYAKCDELNAMAQQAAMQIESAMPVKAAAPTWGPNGVCSMDYVSKGIRYIANMYVKPGQATHPDGRTVVCHPQEMPPPWKDAYQKALQAG